MLLASRIVHDKAGELGENYEADEAEDNDNDNPYGSLGLVAMHKNNNDSQVSMMM